MRSSGCILAAKGQPKPIVLKVQRVDVINAHLDVEGCSLTSPPYHWWLLLSTTGRTTIVAIVGHDFTNWEEHFFGPNVVPFAITACACPEVHFDHVLGASGRLIFWLAPRDIIWLTGSKIDEANTRAIEPDESALRGLVRKTYPAPKGAVQAFVLRCSRIIRWVRRGRVLHTRRCSVRLFGWAVYAGQIHIVLLAVLPGICLIHCLRNGDKTTHCCGRVFLCSVTASVLK
jgi:hypothetical protein